MKTVIKDCRIISKDFDENQSYCIVIENGLTADVLLSSAQIDLRDCEIINACNLYASAGFIDMHCHLREPGFEYKEDIESGTAAAAAGGFTTVAAMANTNPVTDNVKAVNFVLEKAKKAGNAEVLPIGAVTYGLKGEKLTDFVKLKEAGVKALSDDGRPVLREEIMKKALIEAKKAGLTVISHCEELSASENDAEYKMVERDCRLSLENDAPVHLAHISSEKSVDIIRKYKSLGAKITCETCPHYFSLTKEDEQRIGANAKMNPPLRTEKDVKAVVEGLKDGTIDIIATDHAPHSIEEKAKDFKDAPSGIIGLETAFAVSVTYLVKQNKFTLEELISKLTVKPASILNISKGSIKKGYPANIVLFNPDEEITVDKNSFKSKSRNTPFNGKKLFGRIYMTILNGKIVYNGGLF